MEIRQKIITFLMFNGKAEEAMDFYISLFEDSGIINITRYGEEDVVNVGKVMYAAFKLNGQEFMCIDSIVNHNFTLLSD